MPVMRESPVGALLAYWRKVRRLSQLALASEAEISARHLCFLETGRSQPSREMLLLLASVLDVPLRERNALLLAAGFAPVYRESDLDAPALASVRAAVDAILHQHEPFPAVVLNRRWDILQGNQGAGRFFAHLLDGREVERPNVLRLIFDPAGLRPHITNWPAAAEALVRRVAREAVGGVPDADTMALLDEVFAYPDVPARWRRPDHEAPQVPVVPVSFRKAGCDYHFFSAVTTLGTAQDVTLQEIRLESFFPADPASGARARALLD